MFEVSITIDAAPSKWVPKTTRWWIVVDPRYPAGRLDFYPSRKGGLEATFPHQMFNGREVPERPWRSGKLCLRTDISSIKLAGEDVEPMEESKRLVWNVRQARQWLECAAHDELIRKGDPFELPDFRAGGHRGLVFFETANRLDVWQASTDRSGFVTIRELLGGCPRLVATAFEDIQGRAVIPENELGHYLGEATVDSELGVWVRLDEVPVIAPWQAPQSWKELLEVVSVQDIDLRSEIQRLVERRLRKAGQSKDEGLRHPLLIGFPIPEVHGGEAARMHWIGFRMPVLSCTKDTVNGFSAGRKASRIMRDRRTFGKQLSDHIEWLPSKNWSDKELTGRGSLPLADHRAVIVGCGALGSQVAEQLVRGGLRSLALVDGEFLEAGNLVRHTLDLADIGKNKAAAVAERLHRITPHLRAQPFCFTLNEVMKTEADALLEPDLVIDCTADDGVLFDLEHIESRTPRTFVSICVGPYAQRLYLFLSRGRSFPRLQL